MEGKMHANEDRFVEKLNLLEDYLEQTLRANCQQSENTANFFENCSLFSVIDGHGGPHCAQFIQDRLAGLVVSTNASKRQQKSVSLLLSSILEEAIRNLESEYTIHANRTQDFSGACLVVALVYENCICVANVGDCLAVCYDHKKKIRYLSQLHRAVVSREQERIESVGGFVENGRAMGEMIPSRSIGDLDTKRRCPGAVTAEPYITSLEIKGRSKSLPLLLLGTDGLWDPLEPKEACKMARAAMKVECKTKAGINPLMGICQLASLRTKDDITAILVKPANKGI